jgi:tetratricopeptide (TPR) repeat protein
VTDKAPHSSRAWAIIFGLALLVRLAYFLQISELVFVQQLVGDAAGYDAWAKRIASGALHGDDAFYQAPLYPYFLAILYTVVTPSAWVVRVVQATLGSLACVMVGRAAGTFFSRSAGLACATMLALYPPAVYFDGILQKSSLGFFLMASLLLLMANHGRFSKSWLTALGLGAVLGLLALTRENALALVPIVAVWVMQRSSPASGRGATSLAPFVLGLGIFLAPVAWHNHDRGGAFSVTTFQMGPNFYMGNHAGADGRYQPMIPGRETPQYERADATALAEEAVGRPLAPKEVSDYWMDEALSYIRKNPVEWLKLLTVKWQLTWNRYEIPDTESYRIYRDRSVTLSIFGSLWHFGVLTPIAVLGAIWSWPRRREIWILYTMALVMALAVAAFYVFARYRYPLVPIVAMFAGFGATEAWRRANTGRLLRSWPAIGIAAMSAVWINWRVNPEQRLHAGQLGNLGATLASTGKIEESIPYFEEAVAVHPDAPRLRQFLADGLSMTGRYQEAISHYEAVLQSDPERAMANFNFAVALEATGRKSEALAHFQRALARDPDDAEAAAAVSRLTAEK